jgi:hypothetical protein
MEHLMAETMDHLMAETMDLRKVRKTVVQSVIAKVETLVEK